MANFKFIKCEFYRSSFLEKSSKGVMIIVED